MYLINGERKHCIDIADRGLQYGDGLFETIEVFQGIPLFLEQHLTRLRSGCERLRLPIIDSTLLKTEAYQVAAETKRGVLKLIITRGIGGRGYRQPDHITPTRLFVLYPYPQYPAHYQKSGVVLRICQQRLSSNTTLAGIKHLNRLEQVLARAEWQDDCYAEGLMLDLQGKLIEGTMSNVFLRYGSDWYTPSLHTCGVAGIMRALVMELAASVGICIVEREVDAKILHQAEEIFITNSVIGIWPVCQLEQSVLNIGSQTRNLQKLLLALRVAESQHA